MEKNDRENIDKEKGYPIVTSEIPNDVLQNHADTLQSIHDDLQDTIFKVATELEKEIKEIKKDNQEVIQQLNIRINELKQHIVKIEEKMDREIILYISEKLDNFEIRYAERMKNAIDKINYKTNRILTNIDFCRQLLETNIPKNKITNKEIKSENIINNKKLQTPVTDKTINEVIEEIKENPDVYKSIEKRT